MKKTNIIIALAAMTATALSIASCIAETPELITVSAVEPTFAVGTRSLVEETPYAITINAGSGNKSYTLTAANGNPTLAPANDANKVYLVPGQEQAAVYAWGTVEWKLSANVSLPMPIVHANAHTVISWTPGSNPVLPLNLTAATARIRLVVKENGTTVTPFAATLHGINTPRIRNGAFEWAVTADKTTLIPPTLAPVPGSNNQPAAIVNLIDMGAGSVGGYVQAIPGSVPRGNQLMEIRLVNGGKVYPVIANSAYLFEAGKEYTITVEITSQGQAIINNVNINNFAAGGEITA